MAYNKYKIFDSVDFNSVIAENFIFDQGSIRWSLDRSKFILEYSIDAESDFISHEEASEIMLTEEWSIKTIEDEQPEQQD